MVTLHITPLQTKNNLNYYCLLSFGVIPLRLNFPADVWEHYFPSPKVVSFSHDI